MGFALQAEKFTTTHWSVIAAASGPNRRQALERLYRAYWMPLCGFVSRYGIPNHEVEDVVQEYVVGLFEGGSLQRANPAEGRFRSYLLGGLRNFLSNRLARQLAQKRGGGQEQISLEEMEACGGSVPQEEVERKFDQEWAETLFDRSFARLSDEACGLDFATRSKQWERLIFGLNETPYPELASEWGLSVSGLKTKVFRLRRRFREILREEVSRTVSDDNEVDGELRHLCAVLGARWT